MELYLQFGHGMKEHCKALLQKWGQGTVILSPRDLTPEQINRFSSEFIRVNGSNLVDPQLYDPRANHHRLVCHEYWPNDFDTSMLLGGSSLRHLLRCLRDLNNSAKTNKYIVPGIYCRGVNEDWYSLQESIISESVSILDDKPRLATICLSFEALRFEEQVESLLTRSESWDVTGYYIVAEHPDGRYLVEDPVWLSNLLNLCSGLKLQGKEVIVGYCSHQMICLSSANVDAIASGTWLNVRSFPPAKFQQIEEDTTSRRVKWYYCPQTLSEYKLLFLDMAYRAGILDQLRSDPSLGSDYADILFSGAQPSSTNYTEQQAFRHYLHCLHEQCSQSRRTSFRETMDAQLLMLEIAENTIRYFRRFGVMGQDRDFVQFIDTTRAALFSLADTRGFVLDRDW